MVSALRDGKVKEKLTALLLLTVEVLAATTEVLVLADVNMCKGAFLGRFGIGSSNHIGCWTRSGDLGLKAGKSSIRDGSAGSEVGDTVVLWSGAWCSDGKGGHDGENGGRCELHDDVCWVWKGV
jgi:hypothetical protein